MVPNSSPAEKISDLSGVGQTGGFYLRKVTSKYLLFEICVLGSSLGTFCITNKKQPRQDVPEGRGRQPVLRGEDEKLPGEAGLHETFFPRSPLGIREQKNIRSCVLLLIPLAAIRDNNVFFWRGSPMGRCLLCDSMQEKYSICSPLMGFQPS